MKTREFLKEVTGLSKQDLQLKVRSLVEELMKLRFRNASGQLEQNHQIRRLRRDIARAQSVMNAK